MLAGTGATCYTQGMFVRSMLVGLMVAALPHVAMADPKAPGETAPRRTIVTNEVVVDEGAQTVFALTPSLTAVNLRTGRQRWRLGRLRGTRLQWAGARLAITDGVSPAIVFVEPRRKRSQRCALTLDLPASATVLDLSTFEHQGETHVLWQSRRPLPSMGVQPPDDMVNEYEQGAACGLVVVDPVTCTQRVIAPAKPGDVGCTAGSLGPEVWQSLEAAQPFYERAAQPLDLDARRAGPRCGGVIKRTLLSSGARRWRLRLPSVPDRCPVP